MPSTLLLPAVLGVEPRSVTVVLFSLPECEFCEEVRERYLKPLLVSPRRHVFIAEVRIDGTRRLRDENRVELGEAELARRYKIAFAPTVMFLGARGGILAPPIVGLSRDFFGAYLESRLDGALKEAQRTAAGA